MIVLDASAALAVLLNVGAGAEDIMERVSHPGETLHVPHLLEVEVLHALRRLSFGGVVSSERASLALGRLRDIRLERYPHTAFLGRIWQLKNNLTACDASYVALAEALDAPLVTRDARLARAPGTRAAVEVYA